MAQIKNPEDGNQRGKVTIVGYSERFFLNAAPPVHIMKDLSEIGKVEKNGKIEIDIDKESRIVFKCNQCTCRFSPCVVKPGDWVVLFYDKAADSIIPIITDANHYSTAKQDYQMALKNYMIELEKAAVIRRKEEEMKRGEDKSLKWFLISLGTMAFICLGVILWKSSSANAPANNPTSFTSPQDVLYYIDGEEIYTVLGNLYIENGQAYDASGERINDVIVESYTNNSAIIVIYPAQWSGFSWRFNVDRTTGNISEIK